MPITTQAVRYPSSISLGRDERTAWADILTDQDLVSRATNACKNIKHFQDRGNDLGVYNWTKEAKVWTDYIERRLQTLNRWIGTPELKDSIKERHQRQADSLEAALKNINEWLEVK